MKLPSLSLLVSAACSLLIMVAPNYRGEKGIDDQKFPDPSYRVITAALTDAGFTEMKIEMYGDALLQGRSWVQFEPSYFAKNTNCMPIEEAATAGLSGRSLALTVSAIEQYNRASWFRDLEFLYARAYYSLIGSAPNLSLGIGQLNFSIAHEILVKENPSADIGETLNALSDDCESLAITYVHIQDILKQYSDFSLRDQLTALSRNYNGSAEPISTINFRKALLIGYNVLGPDFIWTNEEVDFSEDQPHLIFGDYDVPLEDISEYISFGVIAEQIIKRSSRLGLVIVAHVEPEDFQEKSRALEAMAFIESKLRLLGVENDITLAFAEKDTQAWSDEIEIYLGTNPGVVEFVDP